MKAGICAGIQDVAKLEHFVCDYIEVGVQGLLVPEEPDDRFLAVLERVRQLSVPVKSANVFFPGDIRLVETPEQRIDRARIERYVKVALQRAEQVGIQVIVFGSGKARACPPGYSQEEALKQITEHLNSWGEWSVPHGVKLVLEPLRREETNLINTVAEGGELVAQLKNPGVGLLIDTYHMSANGEDPESIAPWTQWLGHVHVAESGARTAPGVHGDDLRPYLRVLRRAGYDQRISIECHWQDFASESATAIAELNKQWHESA